MSPDEDIELSPGFFDLNNAENDDDNFIRNIIPDKIDVENTNNTNNTDKNFVIEFFSVMVLNTSSKPCGCEGGWSRTSAY